MRASSGDPRRPVAQKSIGSPGYCRMPESSDGPGGPLQWAAWSICIREKCLAFTPGHPRIELLLGPPDIGL